MTRPIIAIVGRTNVGKSTLLNRLAGKRLAVVADSPGTTRDRIFASVTWLGRELTVVDTGGWQPKPQLPLEQKIIRQADIAISQADAIIFLCDAQDGVIAADEEIAEILRTVDKPIILAVNKVDSDKQASKVADFHRLGMAEPIAISAYHNRGIDKLMEAVLAHLPSSWSPGLIHSEEAKLSIVGRPNVGKSTLLNALLGEERAIVHEMPGTTRDSIDAAVQWDGKEILIIDTPGIKRHAKVSVGVDYYSLLRALQAINRCDVALLLIDAAEFVTVQDMHIVSYIIEAGKGMVLAINKWDLVPQTQRQEYQRSLERKLRFMSYAPILYISAKQGQGIERILPEVWQVWQGGQRQLPQSAVDGAVKKAVSSYPPVRKGSRQLRIVQAYQHSSKPTIFIVQVNDPELVYSSYRRYLENKLRNSFVFRGFPLQLVFAQVAPQKEARKRKARQK
jgi:GTP-binding protein